MLSPLSSIAQSSTSKFKRISAEKGLSHQKVLSTFQDSKGYIWITTESGVDRFDGYRFEPLTFDLPDEFHTDGFSCVFETKEGEFWVGTEKAGILVFDQNKNLIDHYYHDPFDSQSLSNNWVEPIIEDSKGQIWVVTYGGGLNKYDKETRTFIHYKHDPQDPMSLSENKLYNLEEDKAGHFWIGTESTGLLQFDPISGKVFRNFIHDPSDPNSIGSNSIYDIEIDYQDRIWVNSYGHGLSLLDQVTGYFRHFVPDSSDPHSLPSANITTLIEDPGKGLWIGTQDQGLCYMDFETFQFTTFSHNPTRPSSLSSNVIRNLFIDDEKNLWIGTENGSNIYNPLENQFINYQHDPTNTNSLRTNAITALYEDSHGLIWIGTESEGLSCYDKGKNKFVHYSSYGAKASGFKGEDILCITETPDSNIIIGTKFNGLNIYDRQQNKITQLPYNEQGDQGLINQWVFDVEIDKMGVFWIAQPSGLSRYNPKDETYLHYSTRSEDQVYLNSDFIKHLFLDSKGMLWAFDATNNNWFKIDPENPEKIEQLDLNISPIYLEKNSDILWLESDNGLSSFSFSTQKLKKFTEEDGLPPGHFSSILKDIEGNYWLGSNRGIFHWNPNKKSYKSYNMIDGLVSNTFKQSSAFQSQSDGYIYFGSSEGISSFNPNSLITNPYSPPVHISSLTYFDSRSDSNKPIEVKGIDNLKEIRFPHYCNILSLEFSALSYNKTEKNNYAYQLSGLSENWIDLGSKRTLTLTNLDPKTYTLNVKGSNGDGVWNDEVTTLHIKITPPWWNTWFAYLMYLSIFGALVGLYIRWRNKIHIKQLEKEKKVVERLKQVDKIKDQFLANTSHEIRTPLNGIIGLSDSLLEGVAGPLDLSVKKNLHMISNSGRRLAHLVNDILDFSKLKNQGLILNRQPLDLYATVDIVLALSEPLKRKKPIALINLVPKEIPLVIADENRVQQILFNIVGNAIKFTHKGNITIEANVKENFVAVIISDTGVGIPKERIRSVFQSFEQGRGDVAREYGGTGLGLSITKLLVEQHKGNIDITSEEGKGTVVTFTLPTSDIDRSEHHQEASISNRISTIFHEPLDIPSVEERVSEEKLNGHVLIADDEPINRQVLENHLALGGYHVTAVSDGISALNLLNTQNEFDLVLLDIMMPRMSGYEVAEEIRKTYSANELPIIMLTAKNRIDDLLTGFNAGANDYLTKPFIKSELLARVKTHIHLRSIHIATKQFVPDEFIRTIGRTDITDVELGDHAEKIVTVLFTDIRDYTAISEKMSPTDNFNFVRSYVSIMGPIIEEHSGFINHYLGDGIMAIFPKKPSDALNAAIEMQHRIRKFNTDRIERGRKPIRVGMGMMTGPLVMGIIGHKHRKDTTSISDTVNVAARLEGLTKTFGASIMLSKETIEALDNPQLYHIRNLGYAYVKGKTSKLDIYECYDGYHGDHFNLIKERSNLFESAIQNFIIHAYNSALKDFELLEKSIPGDRVVQLFVDKCRAHLASQALRTKKIIDKI